MEEVIYSNEIKAFVDGLDHTATVEEFDSEEDILSSNYADDDDFESIYFEDTDGDYVAAGKWALIY